MRKTLYIYLLTAVMLALCYCHESALAQSHPNNITFDNKSGEPALVKLIGPTTLSVSVPNGQRRTVNCAAGKYYILVRYGDIPQQYRYTKGESFTVTQTETQYSIISITLHKVVGGDYPTYPISEEEFNRAIRQGR
jgi:hypothetical protein